MTARTTAIDDLVYHRIRAWEAEIAKSKRDDAEMHPKPVITVSRAFGAGGAAIAQRVAEKLNFKAYDREIVERIADTANVRQKVVESIDSRLRENITNWIAERFDTGYFTHSDYLKHLSRVILTISRHESAVVIGRGAQFIVDPELALRIRITGPIEYRVAQVKEKHQLTEKEAERLVRRTDNERLGYGQHHFGQDLRLAENYDMVINVASLGAETATNLIAQAFKERFDKDA